MNLAHVPRLWRTVRHLRYSQLYWRGRYLLERRRPVRAHAGDRGLAIDAPVGMSRAFPEIPLFHRPGSDPNQTVRELSAGVFTHLNRCANIGRDRPDWRLGACATDRLWTVTLHYHAWAHALAEAAVGGNAEASALLEHYLSDWLDRCPLEAPGARELAWNVFAIATRIAWWIRTWHALGESWWRRRSPLAARFLASLAEQAEYVHDHLEWDLRANHLLRDAVGLAWAGRFFDGPQAARWRQTATELAASQAAEQVLPDGAHFELSPMYHVQAMEDFLSLALLIEDAPIAAKLQQTWSAMAEHLAWIRHPDGHIPLLGDSAMAAVCEPSAMLACGGRLGVPTDPSPRRGGRHFERAGLVAWHDNDWTVFWDVGPVGPAYQPAHGHADTLNCEASFRGRRVFVDPGTYAYDDDQRRRRQRGTASHNTVCIDGADSSEVWGIFRVGRRARPLGVRVDLASDRFHGHATHDGYDHLPGRPRHERLLRVDGEGALTITDRISGECEHRIAGGLLVEPSWRASERAGGWRLADGEGRAIDVDVSGSRPLRLAIEPATYSPQFGLELPTVRLAWRYAGSLPLEVTTATRPARSARA